MSRQRQNCLIVFTGFDADHFLQDKNRDAWEVLHASDFIKKTYVHMLLFLRKDWRSFVVGRSDLQDSPAGFLVTLMLMAARAQDAYAVDSLGSRWSPYGVTSEQAEGTQGFSHKAESFLAAAFHFYARLLKMFFLAVWYVVYHIPRITLIAFFLYCFVAVLSCLSPKRAAGSAGRRPVKKIMYLRTDYFGTVLVGGSYTHLRGFCEGAQKLGVSVSVVAHSAPSDIKERFSFHQVAYRGYGPMPEVPEMAHNFSFFPRCLKLLCSVRPDLLCHRHSLMHVSTILLSFLMRIPLLVEYNGSDAWIREKWGGKIFFKHLALYAEKTLLRYAHAISVVSQALADELVSRGIPAANIIVNPNGVDPDQFSPEISGEPIRARYGIDPSHILIGFIGSFGPWHGIDIVARSVAVLFQKNPRLRFLLIGDGALKVQAEHIIRDAGVGHIVILPGSVPHHEVPAYLRACDILVSPHKENADGSRFFGSPTKLFEYMAVGRPIVASRLEQLAEILRHQETAYLIAPGSEEEFVHAILKLSQDAELRERMGQKARKEVLAKYTWADNAQRILDFIN